MTNKCPKCGNLNTTDMVCWGCGQRPYHVALSPDFPMGDGVLPPEYWEKPHPTWPLLPLLPQSIKCRIYKLHEDLPLPTQANPGDAGWDVVAAESMEFVQGETKLVPLGIIAEAPLGYHFGLYIRSSLAKKGWSLANGVGVIDHAYCGETDEIKALMRAPRPLFKPFKLYKIERGDRICQLILEKNNDITWDVQTERNFAGKSRGGFGSSG